MVRPYPREIGPCYKMEMGPIEVWKAFGTWVARMRLYLPIIKSGLTFVFAYNFLHAFVVVFLLRWSGQIL